MLAAFLGGLLSGTAMAQTSQADASSQAGDANVGLLSIQASAAPAAEPTPSPPLAALKLMVLELQKSARERDGVKARNHGLVPRDFMLFIDQHFLSWMALDGHLQSLALPGTVNGFAGDRAALEHTMGLKTHVSGDSASAQVSVSGNVRGHFDGDTFVDPVAQAYATISGWVDRLPDIQREIARREAQGDHGEADDILRGASDATAPPSADGHGSPGAPDGDTSVGASGAGGAAATTTATQKQLETLWAKFTDAIVAGFRKSESRANRARSAIERSRADNRYEASKAHSEQARVDRVVGLERDALKDVLARAMKSFDDLLSRDGVTLGQARSTLAPFRERRDSIFKKANAIFDSVRGEADSALQ